MSKKPVAAFSVLLFAFLGCMKPEEPVNSAHVDIDGTYKCLTVPGNPCIRNWGREYWQLDITNNAGVLSFVTARGLQSFSMAVHISQKGNEAAVKLDSLIWAGYLALEPVSKVRPGSILMKLNKEENYIFVNGIHPALLPPNDTLKRELRFDKQI